MTRGYPHGSTLSSAGSRPRTGQLPKREKPPAPTRPVFLTFTDISEEDLARAAKAATKVEVKQLLKECMKIDHSEGFRTEILADLHYHYYAFCMSRNFTPDKTSTVLSIMKIVLEEAVSRRLDLEGAFKEFKDWLLKHGVQRPPYSIGIFTFDDVKAITDYVYNSFFRHYRLYMYVYMLKCELRFQTCVPSRLSAAPPAVKPAKMTLESEVDPRKQPELAADFEPSDAEKAEAMLRELRKGDETEDRAALIKRKVDEGVAKLMENFEEQLKEQDAKFSTLMQEAK